MQILKCMGWILTRLYLKIRHKFSHCYAIRMLGITREFILVILAGDLKFFSLCKSRLLWPYKTLLTVYYLLFAHIRTCEKEWVCVNLSLLFSSVQEPKGFGEGIKWGPSKTVDKSSAASPVSTHHTLLQKGDITLIAGWSAVLLKSLGVAPPAQEQSHRHTFTSRLGISF